MKYGIIIPAGGKGQRFGGNKLLAPLGDKTVLETTLSALLPLNAPIVLAGMEFPGTEFAEAGQTRTASVFNGFQVLMANHPETEFVLIHDGARPLVTSALVMACLMGAKKTGVAVAAHRVVNTIKQADDQGIVMTTPDRSRFWEVETPQVIRADLLRQAYAQLDWQHSTFTDDSQLIEAAGLAQVQLIENLEPNTKITTPSDIMMVSNLLGTINGNER